MAAVLPQVMDAIRSKLNVTWDSEVTDARLELIVDTVQPPLNTRLGFDRDHEFTRADGEAWGLFLNACLYEYSDALDDFWVKYGAAILSCRLLNVAGDYVGDADA